MLTAPRFGFSPLGGAATLTLTLALGGALTLTLALGSATTLTLIVTLALGGAEP